MAARQRGSSRSRNRPRVVFLSHNTRDHVFAKHFATFLKHVSGNTIKPFYSSDLTGENGIPYGENWYEKILEQLDHASELIAIVTPRSLNRPWILYETGITQGAKRIPAIGLCVGVSPTELSDSPLSNFQNLEVNLDSLLKLAGQFATVGAKMPKRRILSAAKRFLADIQAESNQVVNERAAAAREAQDGHTLFQCHAELGQMVRSVCRVLSDKSTRDDPGEAQARLLATHVLGRAQRCLTKFCPDSVCCLKVAASRESLKCFFPDTVGNEESPYLPQIEVAKSYSGQIIAHALREPIFVADWRNREQLRSIHDISFDYSDEVTEYLDRQKIRGFVLWPILIRSANTRSTRPTVAAVLKVDFRTREGLVDNPPIRSFLQLVADILALGFELARLRSPSQPKKRS